MCPLALPPQALTLVGQRPAHGAHRGQVPPFIEKGGVDGSRSHVGEAFAVEFVEQGFSFGTAQGQQ
jgi:hypothetical protein